jgi:hypothetical protein
MKYSLNTFKLYKDESIFAMIMRIRVVMKEKVDVKKLKSAVNIAIKRYPYFAVRVGLDEDGGYILMESGGSRDPREDKTASQTGKPCSERAFAVCAVRRPGDQLLYQPCPVRRQRRAALGHDHCVSVHHREIPCCAERPGDTQAGQPSASG